ncbi:hypothetical protein PENTCL1PPCAC_18337, partial [Pristionchus entomophagus]
VHPLVLRRSSNSGGCLSSGSHLRSLFLHSSKRNYQLRGRHAVVTGGSKGIGKEIAKSLLKRGSNVSIFARKESDLKKACEELQTYANQLGCNQQVRWYSVDMMTKYQEIEETIRVAETELGPVDVLINNAGHSVQDAFEKIPIDDFEKQVRVNYLSAVFATRAVVGGMQSRRSGHISFVSSAAGQCAIYGYTAYSPTKFALRGLADSLHMELQPYKIGVSLLYPPNTETEGFKEELLSMPEELVIISDAGGLASPSQVAEAHVKDIMDGGVLYYRWVRGMDAGCSLCWCCPREECMQSHRTVSPAWSSSLRDAHLCGILQPSGQGLLEEREMKKEEEKEGKEGERKDE